MMAVPQTQNSPNVKGSICSKTNQEDWMLKPDQIILYAPMKSKYKLSEPDDSILYAPIRPYHTVCSNEK